MLQTSRDLDLTRAAEEAAAETVKWLCEEFATSDDLSTRLLLVEESISGRVVFSTSLGIEDQVLLHAIAKSNAKIEAITLDTGRHFPETYEVLARTERAFGKRIQVIMPEASDVEQLVARDGISGFRDSVEKRKACCDARKVWPLRRELAGASAWMTGVRRDQSSTRGKTPFASFDMELNLIKINPLADWSLDRIETYVSAYDVPVNALHARGFPSIGCQPCTRAVAPGESIRAGRWWWEDEGHKECGLHNRPGFGAGAAE